ncbi:DUF3857 domain-containing protein [Flammeovirga aprica]|uniref:DUF3857 and transglutaminase domain-containing protein n=1 Tax=Flammeovirga aprica JL-4 TaxID=694437 RepID=A0A7X9NZ78_9BACT|nr:DUF3857 domain-containing protein [Flammeovirga aprica]NME66639.1 DUF3857 and transglutaminase domain-containing protein [Flammeovirga aprica JL-4]
MSKLNFLLLITFLFTSIHISKAQSSSVLSYDKEVFFDGKKKKTTHSYKVLVSSKANHDLGDLSVYYSLGEDIDIHNASISDLKGNVIRSLKKKDFHKKNAVGGSTYYDDNYMLYAELKTNQYPHILEFSYTSTVKNMLYLGYFSPNVFDGIPTEKATFKITYPSDFPVRIKADDRFEFQESEEEEYKTMVWKLNESIPFTAEKNSPHARNLLPVVMLVPEKFSYGIDQKVTNWTEYGEWIYGLNAGLDDLTEAEKTKIHQLTDHLETPAEKVKVLYNYMQDNTRYINISFGIGGLRAHPASYVCENKYGDCKALTNYMQCMLKEVGIPSYMVDVYAGNKIKAIDTTFPAQQFNHVILGVVLDKDTVFLENTSKTNPYNHLGVFTQNRKGFWIEEGKSRLIDLPCLSKENTLDSVAYTFSLADENSKRKVWVNISSSGGERYEMLNYFADDREETQEEVIRRYILPFDFSKIDSIQIKKEDRNIASIHYSLTGEYHKLERKIAGMRVITPPEIMDTKIKKPSERVNPYWINVVVHKKEHYEFPMEQMEKLTIELPEDFHLKSEFGEYKDHYFIKGNKIYLDRSIYVKPNKVSLEDYPAFYEFYKSIHKRSKQSSIVIKQQT